jgi:hypothetical protein
MDEELLENTESKFRQIVATFGKDDAEALERQLQSLLHRHAMDIRNAINRRFSDLEVAATNL